MSDWAGLWIGAGLAIVGMGLHDAGASIGAGLRQLARRRERDD